jgi:hypothetical protein
MLRLYEISPEFADLVEQDDLTDQDAERLDELGHALEVKASNIAALTDNMGLFVDMCKAEENRISAKRKAVENKIKWVNDYLKNNMEIAGVMNIEIGTRKISLQKNPPKLVVDDENKIPSKYFVVIPESFNLDKKRLLKDLKDIEVAGCHSEQGLSLRKK